MTDTEFESIFREHKDAVYRFAWRMTGSPEAAEDIAQDVFISLLRRPDAFDETRGTLRSFLLGAVRNLSLKRWRGERRLEELEDEQFAAQPVETGPGEVGEIVARAVGSLPILQREVLILSEYEGLSLDEVSRAVQAEVGTVKARLHRARENLRRILAPLKRGNTVRMTSHGTLG